jgi:hypothetical protein
MLRTAAADTTEAGEPGTRPSSLECNTTSNPNYLQPSPKKARHEHATAHPTPILSSVVIPRDYLWTGTLALKFKESK